MSAMTQKQLFEEYQVIRILGEGSFGKVFLIRDEKREKEFAMKKFSKYHIFKNGKENSLIRSARILQVLSHPNIINFNHYIIGGEDEIFLVYEACKKGSLEEIKLHLFGSRDMLLIKEIMHQLGLALQYLKSVAVAHRDIKPSNLTFNSDGYLKVVDFDEAVCFKEGMIDRKLGFGEALEIETSTLKLYSRRSRANSFVGTEIYMSPQMKNHTIADEQCDLWAYGCILFELLSGQTFLAETDYEEELADKIQAVLAKLEKQLQINKLTDRKTVIDLLHKVLEPNPKKRLPIEQILTHAFFSEYSQHSHHEKSRNRLKKFLRGNYNLNNPQGVVDAINMDLIGMGGGYEKFQTLSKLPIYLRRLETASSTSSLLSTVGQVWHWATTLPEYSLYLLVGGTRYLKVKSPVDQNDKIYILYNQIQTIKIEDDKVMIECKIEEEWSQSQPKSLSWKYEIKDLRGSQERLGELYERLIYVLSD